MELDKSLRMYPPHTNRQCTSAYMKYDSELGAPERPGSRIVPLEDTCSSFLAGQTWLVGIRVLAVCTCQTRLLRVVQ